MSDVSGSLPHGAFKWLCQLHEIQSAYMEAHMSPSRSKPWLLISLSMCHASSHIAGATWWNTVFLSLTHTHEPTARGCCLFHMDFPGDVVTLFFHSPQEEPVPIGGGGINASSRHTRSCRFVQNKKKMLSAKHWHIPQSDQQQSVPFPGESGHEFA